MSDLKKNGFMGRVVGDLMTVEWQKRGSPHIHILIIFAPEASLKTAQDYDGVVCAEIPPPNHPLHEKVLKHDLHLWVTMSRHDNQGVQVRLPKVIGWVYE